MTTQQIKTGQRIELEGSVGRIVDATETGARVKFGRRIVTVDLVALLDRTTKAV